MFTWEQNTCSFKKQQSKSCQLNFHWKVIHSFYSLLGDLDIGFVLVFLEWLQKTRCAFWTEKLRQRKIYIYHMGFTFYVAVELSPWLSFLSCKITIFSVGVTTCNSDFSDIPPKIKHIENGTNTSYFCFGFFLVLFWFFFPSHSSLILFRLLHCTYKLSFSVHQPDCRLARQSGPLRQHGSCLLLFIILNMITTPLLRLHWLCYSEKYHHYS